MKKLIIIMGMLVVLQPEFLQAPLQLLTWLKNLYMV